MSSIEAHIMEVGAARHASKAEQDKAFASLREYCEAHPEEAKAFSSSQNGVSPDEILTAFYKGWDFFSKISDLGGTISKWLRGEDSRPPTA